MNQKPFIFEISGLLLFPSLYRIYQHYQLTMEKNPKMSENNHKLSKKSSQQKPEKKPLGNVHKTPGRPTILACTRFKKILQFLFETKNIKWTLTQSSQHFLQKKVENTFLKLLQLIIQHRSQKTLTHKDVLHAQHYFKLFTGLNLGWNPPPKIFPQKIAMKELKRLCPTLRVNRAAQFQLIGVYYSLVCLFVQKFPEDCVGKKTRLKPHDLLLGMSRIPFLGH